MTNIIVAIVFGGSSTEHNESIRATRILYKYAIKSKLDRRYTFEYFYLTRKNKWANATNSFKIILTDSEPEDIHCGYDRMLELQGVDVIYNTTMGMCGENGNIAGLADILHKPIIGCGILASSICLDKHLSKNLADSINVPTVDSFYVNRNENVDRLVVNIEDKLRFPCFVKPTNLGTCAFVFRANNAEEFVKKWKSTIKKNHRSETYLIEKYIRNTEVRVFIREDLNDRIHVNDEYVTELREKALVVGGGLFDHLDNELPTEIREKICRYAVRIFRCFKMKDYCRIDFFVGTNTHEIYFNEANTQPFISTYNIKLMEKDGISYAEFLDTMIRRNLQD